MSDTILLPQCFHRLAVSQTDSEGLSADVCKLVIFHAVEMKHILNTFLHHDLSSVSTHDRNVTLEVININLFYLIAM